MPRICIVNGGGGGGWRNFYRDTAAVVVVVEQGRFGAIRDQSINSIKPEWEHWSNNNDCGGLGTWWWSSSGSVVVGSCCCCLWAGTAAFVYRSISILCRNLNCNSMWTNQVAFVATTTTTTLAGWLLFSGLLVVVCLPGNGSIAF